MANRNERHFLEFYTPARFRQRRAIQTEGQQRNPRLGGKENPHKHSTPRGKGEIDRQSQRRRFFTRSASKSEGARGEKHFENTSRDLANVHYEATTLTELKSSSRSSEFASPQANSPRLHRTLFSVDDTNGINTSPSYTSPSTATSNVLLKEYRSKQSLLSSSKTRVSSFSSPISGGLRLHKSSFWKFGRLDNKNDTSEKNQQHQDSNSTLPTINTADSNASPDAWATSKGTNNKIVETTPSLANDHSAVPSTSPKRYSLWSPPGTSRLLRKYHQRVHERELKQQSPPSQSPPPAASPTTPKSTGRRRLRLLDSGAKRCRNHRLDLQSRNVAYNETGDHETKPVIFAQNTPNTTDTKTVQYPIDDNRILLSPSTASRLQHDIESYRHAHDQAKHTTVVRTRPTENEIAFDTKPQTKLNEENKGSIDLLVVPEDQSERSVQLDAIPSYSNDLISDTFKFSLGETTIDELPLEEQDKLNCHEGVATLKAHETTECNASKDTASTKTMSKEISPSTKFSSINLEESPILRSTPSANSARRKSLADAVKAVSDAELAITGETRIDSRFVAETPFPSLTPPPLHKLRNNEQETLASDTPSSKGSLQSIWDTLNCGGGESGHYSSTSPESRDAHANIVSRCSDCVNPMASTLMKMWREEEKDDQSGALIAQNDENHLQVYGKEKKRVDDDGKNNVCGWASPPRKAFSSDLTLVYGLERATSSEAIASSETLYALPIERVKRLSTLRLLSRSCNGARLNAMNGDKGEFVGVNMGFQDDAMEKRGDGARRRWG
eukprot:jgi/Psemu1/36949/gm1.36949_g